MIDFGGISIPFLPEYCTENGDRSVLKDPQFLIRELGMTMDGSIHHDNGKMQIQRLRHKFESLPSSYASVAFKVIDGTDFKCFPHVKIAGCPAKLLQGHNVYGSDNAELCLFSLMEAFTLAFPELSTVLHWEHATIDYIDVTYTAHCESPQQAQQCLDALRNLNYGQTRVSSDHKQFKTTIYFNKGSEHRELKVYLKDPELDTQIQKLTRRWVNEKYDYLAYQLEQITKPEIREWASTALRFEARLHSRWLKANGVPCTFAYITDPANQPDLPALWTKAFNDIFKTFAGATMNAHDKTEVLNQLRAVHFRTTPSGNISYAKAETLYDLYAAIMKDGFKKTKARICERSRATWKRKIDDLQSAGLSLAQLMQFTGDNTNVIPLIRLINVDFANQLPADFIEPLPLSRQIKQPQLRLAS